MIRQELNPETCRLEMKQQKKTQGSWRFRCSFNPCNWPKLIPDCVNSAAKTCQNRRGGSWVEPLPITEKISRYAWLIRPCITTNWQCLRWAVSVSRALPPCIIFRIRKGEDKERKRERRSFTSIQMLHTHTRPEPGQPWKAKGRKKRTHEGQTAKNSAGGGGEQTDLRNQPTRRNGPKQNSAHT